jgi:hypothetical protein
MGGAVSDETPNSESPDIDRAQTEDLGLFAPSPERPTASATAAQPVYGPPPGQPPYGAPPAFAPQPRYREPWINPAKRGAAAVIAVAVALALLGTGAVFGFAAGRHSGSVSRVRQMPGRFPGFGQGGRFGGYGPGYPGRMGPHPFPTPSGVPAPATPVKPSATKTG